VYLPPENQEERFVAGQTERYRTGIGWSESGIFLFGVSRTDSLTYLLVATLLTSVVFAASWAPARRAMRVDPIVALRYE
jgi:ABC-type lipoprotein release transport system permease subunit